MKTKFLSVITLLITLFFSLTTRGQSFGISASAVYLSDCNQSNFFNSSGSGGALIGPSSNSFNGYNFGVHTQNAGTLILRGGAVTTAKTLGAANVCNVRMYYRVYLQSAAPGAFNSIDLPNTEDCNTSTNQFSSGSSCSAGDQRWYRVISDGTTTPYTPVNLTAMPAGNYFLEVYYEATGSSTSTTLCDETKQVNNSGAYFKASFSIQAPIVSGTNPTTCNGTEGSITISGLASGTTYAVKYSDDGVMVGPNNYVANGSGQIILTGLNAGLYADFTLSANGCSTDLNTGLILSNPLTMPTFTKIAPFCAGSTPPTLPTTSNNGITGTWSPSVIDNQTSRSYTFTPNGGQCGIPVTINVTVTPNVTPTFSFGTSLTICDGGTVPSLPNTSTNGVSGSWSPATVDNHASATYTFTPTAGQCALPVTFTVTVNPNVTPTFGFGTSQTICAGSTAPVLPTTSTNGITGTWSPSAVDNQNSATYTFTPAAGQCALPVTLNVTVTPNVTPTFSFGTSLTICAGTAVPTLPTTSSNGVSGTWSPSTVSNQNSATYTFTPSPGQCAVPVTFDLTVTPNTVPVFSFGTALTICDGGTVPVLPTTSTNGVNGSWSPAVVNNHTSGVYTFTPVAAPGQCILTTTFTVTVKPILTPTFSFGNTITLCSGSTAPVLATTSTNGVTGTWNPAVINNQATGTYTFTTSAGQCAVSSATLTVAINPTPVVNVESDTTVTDGTFVPAHVFTGVPAGLSFNWTNSNTSIGLSASGSGNLPSFTALNKGAAPAIGVINVTPTLNGCTGVSHSYKITVLPLEKDVFVPNVFTPNGDGKNEILFVYGNYISKLDMRIFNQWGELIFRTDNKTKGWDGTRNGTAQPVGVYLYALEAVLTDGRTVKINGNINLLR